ncbi:MAG: MotA/TolQ/ExbB proton channel family protein [Bacteroidales bacterium]|nr:MotA/TolQ/ExbB proton channel family protein [Bacteroidales bacterium]MBN2817704.1 MotA/TolQ/ExbB proton channel family protein [Bacteroidales bacterium]
MKNLFFMGGALFMSVLTLLLLIMAVWIIYHLVVALKSQQASQERALSKIATGKSIGLFAMVTGIFGQLLGIYSAFSAIEQAGDISPALVYGGIKVSMITTLYGIIIYLLSLILWFTASLIIEKKLESK